MKNKLAILYDYDGTLAPGSIQEPKLIPLIMPSLKKHPEKFWEIPNKRAAEEDLDGNLMYMNVIIEKAQERGIKLTKEFLRNCGSYSEPFPGVVSWFERMNKYGEKMGIKVEHYLISSGNTELLVGTKIAKYFTDISACKFYFNEEGVATEAGTTVNDHTKTKFIENIRIPSSEKKERNPSEKNKLPYANMIYIGDGVTDIPAMRTILTMGGASFAVYSDVKGQKRAEEFKAENLINNFYPAESCYKKGSALEKTIFKIIDQISRTYYEDQGQLTIFDIIGE